MTQLTRIYLFNKAGLDMVGYFTHSIIILCDYSNVIHREVIQSHFNASYVPVNAMVVNTAGYHLYGSLGFNWAPYLTQGVILYCDIE